MLVDYLSQNNSVRYFDTSKYIHYRTLATNKSRNSDGNRTGIIFFQFMNWMRFCDRQYYDITVIDRFLLSNCVYTLENAEIWYSPQSPRG